MPTYRLDLSQQQAKIVHPIDIVRKTGATSPTGETLDFTNYYMTLNGKPFFGVMGEFHFSRMKPRLWDAELAKMAANGINVVSTYIFWNHHEEEKGVWNWSGRRNLRRFIKLCQQHGLYVVLRLGPFDHGEVRNGGIPDWVYSEPCEARSTDPHFLALTQRLYEQIAQQAAGLYFADGGPIIAAQLDNEYMHSSAPWEFLSGITEEWVPGGHEGAAYLETLRAIAEKVGINVPFNTSTGWGGAPVSDDVLPLWGGYPYRPWLFYSHTGEHPKTDEYLYRDYHSVDVVRNEDFDPAYQPDTRPYACCEMGGGMTVSYNYRFSLPMKSVDAMANIKIGSGCNFLGYYMFQGGSNPIGNGVYLNEGQVPKVSYDYQAPLGEFGQMRESYRRLRILHYFVRDFGEQLLPLPTVLPNGQDHIDPADVDTLRWNIRSDGERGFVFINNFQDHAQMHDLNDISIELPLRSGETVRFENLGLAAGENTILPFNLDLDGDNLTWASAQPVAILQPAQAHGKRTFIFMRPEGMCECALHMSDGQVLRMPDGTDMARFELEHSLVLIISRNRAQRMSKMDASHIAFTTDDDVIESSQVGGGDVTINDAVAGLYSENNQAVIENTRPGTGVEVFPETQLCRTSAVASPVSLEQPHIHQINSVRWIVRIPSSIQELLEEGTLADIRMRLTYRGDIGWLFAGTELLDDNFCNNDTFEIGLANFAREISDVDGKLVFVISPLKHGAKVNVESSMAARKQENDSITAQLDSVELVPVFRESFAISK